MYKSELDLRRGDRMVLVKECTGAVLAIITLPALAAGFALRFIYEAFSEGYNWADNIVAWLSRR